MTEDEAIMAVGEEMLKDSTIEEVGEMLYDLTDEQLRAIEMLTKYFVNATKI